MRPLPKIKGQMPDHIPKSPKRLRLEELFLRESETPDGSPRLPVASWYFKKGAGASRPLTDEEWEKIGGLPTDDPMIRWVKRLIKGTRLKLKEEKKRT